MFQYSGIIQVIFAEEYDRDHSYLEDMLNRIWEIKQRCDTITNVWCDSANPECWQALKRQWGERYTEQSYKDEVAHCKQYNLELSSKMRIVPGYNRRSKWINSN